MNINYIMLYLFYFSTYTYIHIPLMRLFKSLLVQNCSCALCVYGFLAFTCTAKKTEVRASELGYTLNIPKPKHKHLNP